MTKMVIDANVWIRFASFRNLLPLLNRFDTYSIVPLINRYLLSEIFDTLTKQRWMSDHNAASLISLIERISLQRTENVVYRLSPDPEDNYLFDLAIQNNALYIISDDSKLLFFNLQPVRVRTCSWFLKHFPVS